MYVTYHTPNIYTYVELQIPFVLKKELPSNGIGFPKVSIPQLNRDNRVISINWRDKSQHSCIMHLTLRVASVYLLIEFVGCGPCFVTVVPRCPDTDTPRKNNKVTWNTVASHLCGETSGCTRTGIFSIRVTGFAGCLTFWKWRDGVWHLSFEQKNAKKPVTKKAHCRTNVLGQLVFDAHHSSDPQAFSEMCF